MDNVDNVDDEKHAFSPHASNERVGDGHGCRGYLPSIHSTAKERLNVALKK